MKKNWEVHAALLGFSVSSKVMDGENAGKTLQHNFLVLNYRRKELKPAEKNLTASVVLSVFARPSDIPQYGVAFWVTEKDKVAPVQAAGGYPSL